MSSLQMLSWVMDGNAQADGVDRAVLMVIANGGDGWATESEIAAALGLSMEDVAVSLYRLNATGDMDALREVRDAANRGRWPADPPSTSYQKRSGIRGSLRKQVMEDDRYRCVHCSTHIDLTIDHIVPEVHGGTDERSNLQTLCRSCNSRKGDR